MTGSSGTGDGYAAAGDDPGGGRVASREDWQVVEALRRGEEAAFDLLLERYHAMLVRVASISVADRAAAEDVVQETWLGVVRGIHRFEGRSSLKTWIFRILSNCARAHYRRERRTLAFSHVWRPFPEAGDAPGADEWLAGDDARQSLRGPGFIWSREGLDMSLITEETRAAVERAIENLPTPHRDVITLRDLEGWPSREVCQALQISEGHQRVLLHRARSRVRRGLEPGLAAG